MNTVQLAAAALCCVVASSVQAQSYDAVSAALLDQAQIRLMSTQTQALNAYVRRLATWTGDRPCESPPQLNYQAQPTHQVDPVGRSFYDAAQSRLARAQSDAVRAYTECMRAVNLVNEQSPPPQANQGHKGKPVADYVCVNDHVRAGWSWASALQACTTYEAPTRPAKVDDACVEARVRGGASLQDAIQGCAH